MNHDARSRGQKIAEGSGKNIGAIKSAHPGVVVQVLPVNSTEVSGWGTYDNQLSQLSKKKY